jgi:hypothetical protein
MTDATVSTFNRRLFPGAAPQHSRLQELPGIQPVWRRDDLMLAYLQYLNLRLDTSRAAPVVRNSKVPSYLIVYFQGQHVLQKTITKPRASDTYTIQSAQPGAILTGFSRLLFQVEGKNFALPYKSDTLFRRASANLSPSLRPSPISRLRGLPACHYRDRYRGALGLR